MNDNNGCSILFVDPDRAWLDFAVGTLKEQGITARRAADIGQAERISRLALGPQLVFVDLEFAERAPDQFQHFAERGNRYVVVLFPAGLTPYHMSRIFKLGAYDCVGKPYDTRSLIKLVKSLAEEVCPLAREVVSALAPNRAPAI